MNKTIEVFGALNEATAVVIIVCAVAAAVDAVNTEIQVGQKKKAFFE